MRYLLLFVFSILISIPFTYGQDNRVLTLDNAVMVKFDNSNLKMQVCSDNIIHVVCTPAKALPKRKSLMVVNNASQQVEWTLQETERSIAIRTAKMSVKVDLQTGSVSFHDENGRVLLQEPEVNGRIMSPADVMGEDVLHVKQCFSLSKDEAIYGLGQFQDGVMNYRGHDLTLVQQNTVAVVPFLVSTKGYGILWDNYSLTKFHDGDDSTFLWSEVADAIDYYFIYGPGLDEVIAGYRLLTGKAPLFGKWAYGYWQSKERYWTQEEIISVVKEYRRRRIPLDNIVQDWTYWGDLGWNAVDFDRRRFPNPEAMIQTIHDHHAHYMISIWPNFDSKTEIYKEMYADGFIFHGDKGESRGLYDAFNEKARALYWKWLHKNLFSIGVDAWWMDATEPEFSGHTPEEIAKGIKGLGSNALGTWARYLNAYSLMSCKGVYEHQRKVTDEERVFILTRSAFAGQQRYGAVTWSGDIAATWGVFRKQIAAGLNFCMAGIPYWTTDIGAFFPNNPLGCRDEAYRELYVRWFQFGAFCPVFRSHGTGTPREVWQFGEPGYWAYDTLVKFDELRYRLLPYIYSLAWKVTNGDYTIMRALAFDFGDDPQALNIDNQFMFGPALLVNPVTKQMYFENTYTGEVVPAENIFTQENQRGGLNAEFYNGQNFDTLATKSVESKIEFDWNDGSRPKEVNQHYYSIRFLGYVQSAEAGEYTFVTTSNDGIRLWVNNSLIIDNWTDHGATIDMGKITLKANTKYAVKLEYYQTLGGAITKLAWIRPRDAPRSQPQEMPATKSWPVYLPNNAQWFDFWTGRIYQGGQQISAKAPIDIMPLFVKAGSIVPLGPYLQYASEKPADPIELRVYPGADTEFTLYEDKDDNYHYQKGQYALIPICWDDRTRKLTIGDRVGTFPGMLQERSFHVVIVSEGHGCSVAPTGKADQMVTYKGEESHIIFKGH